MKTVISILDKIFKEVDSFAKEQNCSRSEVFVTAIKEFLEKLKAKKLLYSSHNGFRIKSEIQLSEYNCPPE